MIDNAFRAVLPRFVGPIVALYGRLGWTPNQVTVFGFMIAIIASAAVALHFWWVALALWWLSRLADGTDGVYARETGQESDFGAYFDMVLDMAAYGAMVLGFAIAVPELLAQWMAMLFLYILCITSALSLGMEEAKRAMPPRDNRGLRLGAGLAEGGETGIAYSVFLLVPNHLGLSTTIWIGILLVTVIARSILAYQTLRSEPKNDSDATHRTAGPETTQSPQSSEV
jgi:phosphatidylglycerophosphate synthase